MTSSAPADSGPGPNPELTFLYDSTCGVCAGLAGWVEGHDHAGRVRFVPAAPGIGEPYGLSPDDLDREAWAVDAQGKKHNGADALNRLLTELGPPWAWLARVLSLPGVYQIERTIYRSFAAHRHRLG